MPDLECRLAKVEEHVDMLDRTVNDFTKERRRHADQTNELLMEIERNVSDMQGFSNGVKWTAGAFFGLLGGLVVMIFNRIFGAQNS